MYVKQTLSTISSSDWLSWLAPLVRVLTPEPEVVPKKRVAGFSSVCLSLLESLDLCSPPAAQVKTGGTLGCNLLELGEVGLATSGPLDSFHGAVSVKVSCWERLNSFSTATLPFLEDLGTK